jgi:hypothetical protein
MAEYADKINAAAQAMFPELWEEADPAWGQGALAVSRQHAIDRVTAGLAAIEALEEEDRSIIKPEEFDVPDDLSSLNDSEPATPDEGKPAPTVQKLATPGADGEGVPTITLALPEGAQMLQQSLTIAMYLDDHGRSAYTVACVGEGLTSSWLGMNVLCQDFLLKQHHENGWESE